MIWKPAACATSSALKNVRIRSIPYPAPTTLANSTAEPPTSSITMCRSAAPARKNITTPVHAIAANVPRIWLQHQQTPDEPDDHAERRQPQRNPLDLVALGRQPRGDVDADRELRELGGLQRRQRSDLDPPRRAVLFMSDAWNQDCSEQQQRHPDERRRQSLPNAVVEPRQ